MSYLFCAYNTSYTCKTIIYYLVYGYCIGDQLAQYIELKTNKRNYIKTTNMTILYMV